MDRNKTVSGTLSIYEVANAHPNEKLLNNVLFWTWCHLHLLDCHLTDVLRDDDAASRSPRDTGVHFHGNLEEPIEVRQLARSTSRGLKQYALGELLRLPSHAFTQSRLVHAYR